MPRNNIAPCPLTLKEKGGRPMSRKIIIASICLLALIFVTEVGIVGCGKAVNSPVKLSYFPHEDGYRWEYRCRFVAGPSESSSFKRIRYFDGTTILPSGLTVQNFIVTDEVAAHAAKAFSKINTFGLLLSSPKNYCYIDGTGVYSFGSSSYPATEAKLILPLPLEVGKVWQRGSGIFNLICEAVGEEEIAVPAGTYNAVKVNVRESSTTEPLYYEWYADGIGMVKFSYSYLTTTSTLDSEGRVVPVTSEDQGYYIEELLSKIF